MIGLIESMYAKDGRIVLQAFHQERLQQGFDFYEFKADAAKVFVEIERALLRHESETSEWKVRLEIYPTFSAISVHLDISDFSRANLMPINLGWAQDIVKPYDKPSRFKTTQRELYQQVMQQASERGVDDLIILNERGEVVETTIFNILWQDKTDERWYTPPLSSGCISGVQRMALLSEHKIAEKICFPQDLNHAKSVRVCNALRGVLAVKEIV